MVASKEDPKICVYCNTKDKEYYSFEDDVCNIKYDNYELLCTYD